MKKIIFLGLMFSFYCGANIPTAESLFRNGSNSTISSNTVALKLQLEEIETDDEDSEDVQSREIENPINQNGLGQLIGSVGPGIKLKKKYIKVIFFNGPQNKIHLLQLEYKDRALNKSNLINVKYTKDILGELASAKVSSEKKLFYSTLLVLVLNENQGFVNFLKNSGNERFKTNQELTNAPLKALLDRYKHYLYVIRYDKKLNLQSPLRPSDKEEQQRVKDLMKEGLFVDDGTVRLIKKKRNFYWNVDLGDFKAEFTNENHFLHTLAFHRGATKFDLSCSDYILFNGIHELPKNLILKMSHGKIYRLRTLSLSHINYAAKSFDERVTRAVERLEENLKRNNREVYQNNFEFLL